MDAASLFYVNVTAEPIARPIIVGWGMASASIHPGGTRFPSSARCPSLLPNSATRVAEFGKIGARPDPNRIAIGNGDQCPRREIIA
jgi:hypothetical protein